MRSLKTLGDSYIDVSMQEPTHTAFYSKEAM